jgi:zinc protease
MNARASLFALTIVTSLATSLLSSCVSTQVVKGGPDPRAGRAPPPAPPPTPLLIIDNRSATDPIINLRLVFRRGSAADPVGKEGLTALTARMMAEATTELSASALADALFPMAAELKVFVDKETTVFSGRVHKDHGDAFLKIFGDVITRPRFDAADFMRLREEHRAWLTSTLRTGNDEALQREALEAMIYDRDRVFGARAAPRGHPYAHTPRGTVAGLDAISLADVNTHHGVFTRDALMVGVGGGASDEFVGALQKALSPLASAPSSSSSAGASAPADPPTNQLLIIEKPAAGTAISVGFALPTLSRSHPDYAAMKFAETWFGEHRNLIGHLFNSMREVRGLNYGDYAYVEHFVEEPGTTFERLNIPRQSQYFSMWIRAVPHETRHFALRMTAWELAKFVKDGIPDDESFARVQSFVSGYWPSKAQDPMRRLGYVMDAAALPSMADATAVNSHPMGALALQAQKLTRAEVNAAIKRHLHLGGLSMVVVTPDAAALVADITGGAVATMGYSSAMPDAVVAEDKAIGVFDLGLGEGAIRVVKPDVLFQQ